MYMVSTVFIRIYNTQYKMMFLFDGFTKLVDVVNS